MIFKNPVRNEKTIHSKFSKKLGKAEIPHRVIHNLFLISDENPGCVSYKYLF